MAEESKREYTNQEITITWEPSKCIHSGKCARGLSEVFKPKEKPWIQMGEVSSHKIIEQIEKCPSGALRFFNNKK